MSGRSAGWVWTGRGVLAAAVVLGSPRPAVSEWQIKPFIGLTFGGDTTFVLTETRTKLGIGASGVLLGDVLGIEGQVERIPGLFQDAPGDVSPYVAGSGATVLTGNMIVTLPRRLTEYTLRPYAVAGGGLMHVNIDPLLGGIPVSSTLGAMDVGGGVTGFLTERVGLGWEARWFRSLAGTARGRSYGNEKVSFWRANMALAFRLTRSSP